MATQIIKKLLDDLDGGDADETLHFAFDGSSYKIDLTDKNAAKFRELMSPYQEAAERTGRFGTPPALNVSGAGRRVQPVMPSTAASREQNQKIREWANNNGYEMAERGRIPQHIVEAFESGTPHPSWLAAQKAKALEEEMAPKASARKRATKAVAPATA